MKQPRIFRPHKFIRHAFLCYRNTNSTNYVPLTLVLIGYVLVTFRLCLTRKKIVKLELKQLQVSLNCFSGEITGFWENFLDDKYGSTGMASQSRCVLDVGGNAGFFSMNQILQYGDKLELFTFEPDPDVFERMRSNLENCNKKRSSRLHPMNMACGSTNGTVKLFRNTSCLSHVATEEEDVSRCVEVPIQTLDNVIVSQNIKHIDLIKIDVEGFEFEVLKGAERRTLPITERIAMQYHGGQLQPVSDFLREQGLHRTWTNEEKSVAVFERAVGIDK